MLHRRTFVFIDNDAARAALVKQQSDVPAVTGLLWKLTVLMADKSFFPWYCRVASSSNPADEPSRFAPLRVLRDVATYTTIDFDKVME